MIPLLEEHRDAIAAICRKYGVTRLEVFGSAANGDFDPERSDVDFLVEYAPDAPFSAAAWFGIRDELEALLGRRVDVVEFAHVRNRFVRMSIERKRRELLYAA